MWNVQCILAAHASLRLACLLLLFNRFLRRQWIFLLRFRFLQFRLIELLNLSHIGFVRHGCRGRGANCERVKSNLRCGRRQVPCILFFKVKFYFNIIVDSYVLTKNAEISFTLYQVSTNSSILQNYSTVTTRAFTLLQSRYRTFPSLH